MARKDERSARLRQALARLAQHSTFNTRRTKRHHAKSLRKSGTQETLSIHQRIPKKGKASVSFFFLRERGVVVVNGISVTLWSTVILCDLRVKVGTRG
jgi:hypothetical protein